MVLYVCIRDIYKHTQRNLIKSNWNQIVFTIFRLIWNQPDVRLVPIQSENGEHNLMSVRFNKISSKILCACSIWLIYVVYIYMANISIIIMRRCIYNTCFISLLKAIKLKLQESRNFMCPFLILIQLYSPLSI